MILTIFTAFFGLYVLALLAGMYFTIKAKEAFLSKRLISLTHYGYPSKISGKFSPRIPLTIEKNK